MNAIIVIPHIDDDIYSCWSVLCDKSYADITIVRCTSGKEQLKRKIIHDQLAAPNAEELFGVNPNIKIIDLMGEFEHNPVDGNLSSIGRTKLITLLDKYTSTPIDEFYYPALSHHQDHVYLNECCKASLRARSSNTISAALEYTYPYNHSTEKAIYYKSMTSDDLNHKIEFLCKLNEVSTIFSNSVNSVKYVLNMNTNFGLECNSDAAEKFIPFRIVK